VGACAQIVLARTMNRLPLGAVALSCHFPIRVETARALHRLLTDGAFYAQCSEAIRKRVQPYYIKTASWKNYRNLYDSLLKKS